MLFIPDQNAEALRLEAGETDLMANGEIRPEDYATFKRLSDQGRLKLIDVGIGVDPNFLWFNLSPAGQRDAAHPVDPAEGVPPGDFVRSRPAGDGQYGLPGRGRTHLRSCHPGQSHLVFRVGADATTTTPRRHASFSRRPALPIADGDGMLEDGASKPVRFSIITQRGHTIRERSARSCRNSFVPWAVAVDLVALDDGAIFQAMDERRLRRHLLRRPVRID